MRRQKTESLTYLRITESLAPQLQGRTRLVEGLLYVAVAIAAWWVRMVQDDAFISFRYSKNLAEGHGLVYNPGERIEGYTNFLWTLLMTLPEKLGWNTPAFSVAITIPLAVGTVALTIRLARKAFVDNELLALLTGFALAANMTFLGYATSGLETMLQTTLITAVALLLIPHGGDVAATAAARIGAGVLGGLAVMTRLDSVVLIGTWFLIHVWWMQRRRGDSLQRVIVASAQLGLPVLAIVIPWLVWKTAYYGSIVPNTLAAKSWPNAWVPFLVGMWYLLLFGISYAAFLLIGRWWRLRGTFPAPHSRWALMTVVGVWALYICYVGADFMEFRFIVPVLPVLAMAAAWLLDHYRSVARHSALIALLLLVSLGHRMAPPALIYPVMTFQELRHWPTNSPSDWETLGGVLHKAFPGDVELDGEGNAQLMTGIVPAGAVPYYSELPAIDMLGLNDEWVARNGLLYPIYMPGHVRVATIDYLIERDVSLVLGSIRESNADPERTSYRLSELLEVIPAGDLENLPEYAEVLEVPLSETRAWRFIYLERDDRVETAIDDNGWRRYPIEMVCDDDDILPLVGLLAGSTCED